MPFPDQELYRLFDRSPVGMYRSTREGSFRYVNTALARLLGYSVEELLAVNLNRDVYLDPDAREKLIAAYEPLARVDGARVQWKTRSGKILTVQIYGHYTDTPEGRTFDATVLDVTETEAARAHLEQTATMLELVVQQMPAIYWIVDGDLRLVRSGGAIRQLTGREQGANHGKMLKDVMGGTPPSVDAIATHRNALAGDTVTYGTEYLGKQYSVTIAPYRLPDGTIAGAMGTSIDVTAVRQMERRLVDAQRAEGLGILAGGLAHDFNNLLVGVIGNAELALRELPPGSLVRAAVEDIRTTGLRAAELTSQLLAYSGRCGAGSIEVQPAAVVDELLRILAPAMPKQVQVTVDVAPELAVRADPTQLRQVVLNLVTNARDAIGPRAGSLSIRARAVQHDGTPDRDDELTASSGAYVAIDVADDGLGMDAETRRHIFEPFYTTKRTGHGLGLAAVLGIVRAHGGGVRVVSKPGTGTTFTVLWPAAAVAAAPRAVEAISALTVLVIDDEDLVRDVVARMIQDLGYAAVTAADGPAGLAVIDNERVDAVLVDLTMPRMNGADVIAQVRERRPQLPVILCSGFDRDGRGPVHADAYLPKPFRIEALERTLAKLLA
jgi:two-component system cell cycle sensor histidine kinase/response regulator CckA